MTEWAGVIVTEGELTGDGRFIQSGALRWGDLPIPLRHANEDNGGHDGATVVGKIETLERMNDGNIWATGTFDTGSDAGREAMRQVTEDISRGISVDMDDVDFEVSVAKELVADMMDGDIFNEESEDGEESEQDESNRVKIMEFSSTDEIMVFTSARIRAATLVSIPAFHNAKIEPVDEKTRQSEAKEKSDLERELDQSAVLTASAIPANPPTEWFANPSLSEPTPIRVQKDGKVFGHIATWGTCHIGLAGECTQPPKSVSDYAYFLTGEVLTESGDYVPVGRITLGTKHAPNAMNYQSAAEHYDNTGSAVADVFAGEDEFGIWVAGALRPNVSASKIRDLRASPVSGDWRKVGTGLELVAVLAVNVPGFPTPRTRGKVFQGDTVALVASGVVQPDSTPAEDTPTEDSSVQDKLTDEERETLRELAKEKREMRNAEAQNLRDKILVKDMAERAKKYRTA